MYCAQFDIMTIMQKYNFNLNKGKNRYLYYHQIPCKNFSLKMV